MPWTKLKNIILLILALANLFLLTMVVSQELQDRQAREQTWQGAVRFLTQQGVQVEERVIPQTMELSPQTVRRDRRVLWGVGGAAGALLGGEVSMEALGGEVYRYYNDSGSIQFHSYGAFSAQLEPAAFPVEGSPAQAAQAALSDRVIRLHVLANSDSEADQALKLRVRDAVLAEAEELFVPGAGRAETEELLRAHLYDLAAAGAEVVGEAGYSYPVTASLVHDYWFPPKTYTDFALPAGAYTALRIEIGAGGGQNWWCVVFPPLCLGSVSETTQETALEAGLTENQVSLMTGEDEGYVVKFKAVELLEQFKGWLEGR